MKKGYTLIELLVVISIIGFMAVYCVPAFAKFGRSSDFKQKADEVKMLMQRTYLLSRSPENTSVQAYRMIVEGQAFVLQKTSLSVPINDADWTNVSTVEKLDNNSSNPGLGKTDETIQCDASCYILTCPVNPTEKCDVAAAGKTRITFIDNKITGMNNLASFDFEGVSNDGASVSSTNKPFNVTLKFSK